MVKFKARIWKTGNSKVVTIPTQLIGAEITEDDVIVTIQPAPQGKAEDGLLGIFTPDPLSIPLPA